MMNRSLPSFRGSEMLRTGASIWFYLISSLQRLPSKGLLPHIKEKYVSQEFYSISQMVNRMTGEARPYEQKRSNFQKKVNFVDCSDTSDSDDDQMVGSAE